MKTLKLIALAVFALLFSQCKTTAPTAPTGPAPSLLEVVNILDTTQSKFFEFATATNGDPWKAIELTASWVATQPKVKAAAAFDSTYIFITTTSGLNTAFFFNELDSAGRSINRGGRKSTALAKPRLSPTPMNSKNTIFNKKVLIYAPVDDFSTQSEIQSRINLLTDAGLDVTLLKNEQCTYNIVDQFEDYGLVIIDTHGNEYTFQTGTKFQLNSVKYENDEALKQVIVAKYGSDYYTKLVAGEIGFETNIGANPFEPDWEIRHIRKTDATLFVGSLYIDKLPPLTNTVVFGNFCFSGQTVPEMFNNKPVWPNLPPIGTAFINRNPISYYGYAFDDGSSDPVRNNFATEMEDSLIHELVVDFDSTGSAYLNFSGSEFGYKKHSYYRYFLNLKHFGADDYSYDHCVNVFTDNRDGIIYKSVCIGKQTWMAENLRYDAPGSVCYADDPANCNIYGKLYNWNTVMNGGASSITNPSNVRGICPKNWHLPSDAEWMEMINFLGGLSVAGGALKSTSPLWNQPNIGATNSSGFSALPGSQGDSIVKVVYAGLGDAAVFSSASASSGSTQFSTAFVLRKESPTVISSGGNNANPFSCRCVKDK